MRIIIIGVYTYSLPTVRAVTLFLSLAFITQICFSLLASPVFAQKRDLKIGVLSGLSGIAAKWNHFQNKGIELAQEELTAQGWRIKLVIEDSQTATPKAIAAFNKLVGLDNVDAIIANDFGYVLVGLLPQIAKEKKLFVSISMPHNRYCSEGMGYFFSISSQVAQSEEAFEMFFDMQHEVKSVAFVVFDDQEWGRPYEAIWEHLAKKHNVTVVDRFISSETSPDYKTVFTRLIKKNPDAIFIAHEPEGFFKAKKQFGYHGLVITANNVYEMLTPTPVREELEGVYIADPTISDEFREKFVTRFKQQPILEAYAGYESLMAVAKAFEANSKDPQLGMKSVKYQGVAGAIDFSGSSCVGNKAQWGLYRYHGGVMVRQ